MQILCIKQILSNYTVCEVCRLVINKSNLIFNNKIQVNKTIKFGHNA